MGPYLTLAWISSLLYVAVVTMQVYYVLPPRHSKNQVFVSLVCNIVPALHQICECAPIECALTLPAHVFDSTGKNQACCSCLIVST